MRNMNKLLLLSVMILPLVACATSTPQRPIVEINPYPTVNTTMIGNSKPVTLQVLDVRPQNYASANVDPQQNVAQVFSSEINRALIANDFNVVNMPNCTRNHLLVRIVSMTYGSAASYLGSNTQSTISIAVEATNSMGKFDKTYTASSYSDNYMSPTRQAPSDSVNAAVSQVLTTMFNDSALMHFLAS